MRAAVVGAGPAGAALARRLAEDGATVSLFDASHPREKPCGGGLTPRALALLPRGPHDDPLPCRPITACRFESGRGASVALELARPVGVASRRDLDAWLLRRAVESGAVHVPERVVAVEGGRVRTTSGRDDVYDVVVGADGAGSLVRRAFLGPVPRERLMMAAGWYAQGDSEMLVRFTPGLGGYLWLFPRSNHVGVGICAPLAEVPTRDLLARLEAEVGRWFPALSSLEGRLYAHTIPSPSEDPASILEIAGAGWALAGDAGALADPITGEGIYFALRSAELLADVLRADGSPVRYPARVLDDFGRELLEAAAMRRRFFSPGFVERMVAYGARSAAIRDVLSDLVAGEQGYRGLRRRLLRAAPAFVLDTARSIFSHRTRGADTIQV